MSLIFIIIGTILMYNEKYILGAVFILVGMQL